MYKFALLILLPLLFSCAHAPEYVRSHGSQKEAAEINLNFEESPTAVYVTIRKDGKVERAEFPGQPDTDNVAISKTQSGYKILIFAFRLPEDARIRLGVSYGQQSKEREVRIKREVKNDSRYFICTIGKLRAPEP
ncbi:hypothetical protein HY946_01380 [Candidatus Gottesmanbacteria bacterium]|nr:hypothetical protein [Candidatus Gottesmanbacteria bacterium]